jgi:hypothetical protein
MFCPVMESQIENRNLIYKEKVPQSPSTQQDPLPQSPSTQQDPPTQQDFPTLGIAMRTSHH